MTTRNDAQTCPMHARTLPTDGTPLKPSATFGVWREEGGATPLVYPDGHEGWIVTRHELAKEVLADRRFSQQPHERFPMPQDRAAARDLDDAGLEAIRVADLLGMDGDEHSRLRRLITSRFTVKAARGRQEFVQQVVAEQIAALRDHGAPADAWVDYAQPISARVHREVLGIPDSHAQRFWDLFVQRSTRQEQFDFIRDVLALKREAPGDDLLSDLLAADITTAEVEGLALVMMSSGRDSVAYMIATTTTALLANPEQLAALRDNPDLMPAAVEEFMRYGAMFLTLFPRTATDDIELEGLTVKAGQTVSVSPVGANRDGRRFDHPDAFDVSRDAFGHVGFGHGPHGCVGQQLARIEIGQAVMALVRELPGLTLVHAEQLEPMPFAHPVATYEAGSVIVSWT